MTVHHTKRNMVCAYDPLPEDMFLEIWLSNPEGRYIFSTKTIDKYSEAVDWAIGIADTIEGHIDVLPITGEEYLHRNRTNPELRAEALAVLRKMKTTKQ